MGQIFFSKKFFLQFFFQFFLTFWQFLSIFTKKNQIFYSYITESSSFGNVVTLSPDQKFQVHISFDCRLNPVRWQKQRHASCGKFIWLSGFYWTVYFKKMEQNVPYFLKIDFFPSRDMVYSLYKIAILYIVFFPQACSRRRACVAAWSSNCKMSLEQFEGNYMTFPKWVQSPLCVAWFFPNSRLKLAQKWPKRSKVHV